MRKHGGNNSYGALKGKLTRHAHERVKDWQEEEIQKRLKEIEINKGRWGTLIDKLKIHDPEFDTWYESDSIPEFILWTGKDFEDILKVLRKRLKSVRTEK